MFAVAVTETCSYAVLVFSYGDRYDRMLCSHCERMLFGVRICLLRMHDTRRVYPSSALYPPTCRNSCSEVKRATILLCRSVAIAPMYLYTHDEYVEAGILILYP